MSMQTVDTAYVAALVADAYRRGAEEMRERAAQTMEQEFGDDLAAAAIRALPLDAAHRCSKCGSPERALCPEPYEQWCGWEWEFFWGIDERTARHR